MIRGKRWEIPEVDPVARDRLAAAVPASPILAQLLLNRGIRDGAAGRAFLAPKLGDLAEPDLLPDVGEAAERLLGAVRRRESIWIFGDYDVDGICATTLLLDFLKLLGVDARYYIPSRIGEGYGMNADAIRMIHREGGQLIVTVDTGSSSLEEIDLAGTLGIDIVVTDHHEPRAPGRPKVFVNPKRPDSVYPFRELSGAGVAFKFVWAVAQRFSRARKLSGEFRDFLVEGLALVALGTIADVVPLVGENRIFAHQGLAALERSTRPGLRALIRTSCPKGGKLRASHVAFHLAPRLNAAGRMGRAQLGIELLRTESESEALAVARQLGTENRRRKSVEQDVLGSARRRVVSEVDLEREGAIVLADEDWHPGVIGIVAARMVEEFHRPAILIALEEGRGRGSARSIPGVDISHCLGLCREHLEAFGGHVRAAGIVIESSKVPAFREALNRVLGSEPALPTIHVDMEIAPADLTPQLLDEIRALAPHGEGNPRVRFVSRDLEIAGRPKILGESGNHLSFYLRRGGRAIRAVAFGGAAWYRDLEDASRCSVVYEPSLDTFTGAMEMSVKDIRFGDDSG